MVQGNRTIIGEIKISRLIGSMPQTNSVCKIIMIPGHKMKQKRMDVPPMIFTGNPLIIKPGMVFFMHMILMDSKAN